MDNENRENLRKSCKEPRIAKKSHKRSASQDAKPRSNPLQVNGHHHHHHHHSNLTTQALKPRITKLENLEARMASIEVSLSNALENSGLKVQTRPKTSVNASDENVVEEGPLTSKGPLTSMTPPIQEPPTDNPEYINHTVNTTNTAEVLSSIVISNQSQQITRSQNLIRLAEDHQLIKDQSLTNGSSREDCIRKNQNQIDNKSAIIKNLKLKLENLEVNDLDSRIYQAELECLLEKEEMNLLNLHQEKISFRAAFNQLAITNGVNPSSQVSSSNSGGAITLFSIVSGSQCTSVLAMEVPYQTQSPCFYVTAHHSGKGLIVQWAKDNSKLKKGDRMLEVNGQLVVNCGKDEFLEVLRTSVVGALRIVILRNSPMLPVRKINGKEVESLKEEMSSVVNKLDTKIKENKELLLSVQKLQKDLENLKDENQKLHHRTFYLEDQVVELTRRSSTGPKSLPAPTTVVLPPESKTCGGAMTSAAPARFGGGTSLHYGKSTTGVFRQQQQQQSTSVVKSHSVNQLDKLANASNDHHILQVRIPFSPSEHNIGKTVSSYDVRTASVCRATATRNAYINVPLPKSLSLQAPAFHNVVATRPSLTRWLHGGRGTGGADSDSGNYSGDSMDDTQATGSGAVMTAFVVQRQRQITDGNATANAAARKPVATSQQQHVNHCYVNVVEATSRVQIATGQNRQFIANSYVHPAERPSGDGMAGHQPPLCHQWSEAKYVNQDSSYVTKEAKPNEATVRNLSNLQLKVNDNKIGLNDGESDNEEWC